MAFKNVSNLTLFPFILVFYEISNYLANDMYLPALPLLAQQFNITPHYAQMTLTAFFLGSASWQLWLGPVSDRVGRRPVVLGGGILFIISTLICALTTNIQILILGRFLQGSAICCISAGYSSIHECFDQKKAIHLLAIMGSITVLAPAFGPLLGSMVLVWLDWRWIFGILAIWAFITVSLLWKWMPESHPKEKQVPLNWKQIFKNYQRILSNPTFMLNTLIFCAHFLGFIAWIAAGPFLVIEVLKFSNLAFGIFQVLIFGMLIVGAQFVKPLMNKWNPNVLINMGVIINFVGSVVALIGTLLFPHFLGGLILGLMIYSFGSSLAFSPANRLAIEACTEPMGARVAIFSSLLSIAGVIAGVLVGLTYDGSLIWLAGLLAIVSTLAVLLRSKKFVSTRFNSF